MQFSQVYRQTRAEGRPSPPEVDGEAVLECRQRQLVSCGLSGSGWPRMAVAFGYIECLEFECIYVLVLIVLHMLIFMIFITFFT